MKSKIVYVTSQFPFNNKETWAYEEIDSLITSGIDVIIVPRTSRGQVFQKDVRKLLKNTIISNFFDWTIFQILIKKIIFSPIDFFSILIWIYKQSNTLLDFVKGIFVLPKSLYVSKIIKNTGVAHIHAFSTTSVAVVAYIIAKELNINWSVTYHASWVINEKNKRSNLTHVKSVKFVRVISNQVRESLQNFIDVSLHKKIKMIHLGVRFNESTKAKILTNKKFTITSAGWLLPHKGIDISLYAVKILKEMKFYNFIWKFYGDGYLLDQLKNLAKKLDVLDFVEFKGFIDNKTLQKKYMENEIDLFVSNSLNRNNIHEGIPVSLMEAMSHAIPVIATNCGGTKELVDGFSGILINENSSEETSKAIFKLFNNKSEYENYSANAYFKIKNEFNSTKISKKLINAFFENKI